VSYSFQDFQARAALGHQSECRVAKLLRYWGYDVPDPELVFRSEGERTREVLAEFARTQKDLEVGGIVIEVKSRTLSFTSRADYPYSTVLLDTVRGWQAKDKKPDIYVIVSQPTGAILALDARKMGDFPIEEKTDYSRKHLDQWYICPKTALNHHVWLQGYLQAKLGG
jgi:hypothetical protein